MISIKLLTFYLCTSHPLGTYKVQLPDGRTQVVRYTADNDGYRADVSYLIDKHAVNNPETGGYGFEQQEPEQHYHQVKAYNHHLNGLPTGPEPTPSSTIFVSTAKPPVDIHSPSPESNYLPEKLNLEQRQSISAQPTYIRSHKSTHIDDTIRIVPDSNYIDDDTIAIRPDPALYYKSPPHHSVFYEAH